MCCGIYVYIYICIYIYIYFLQWIILCVAAVDRLCSVSLLICKCLYCVTVLPRTRFCSVTHCVVVDLLVQRTRMFCVAVDL